jgi:ATP synthase protein I
VKSPQEKLAREQERLYRKLREKEERKERARRRGPARVWFGLGMMGVIGWAVIVPTLLGVALGLYLDRSYPHPTISWTLSLLVVGIFLGSLNAWYWVSRESGEIGSAEEGEEDES